MVTSYGCEIERRLIEILIEFNCLPILISTVIIGFLDVGYHLVMLWIVLQVS